MRRDIAGLSPFWTALVLAIAVQLGTAIFLGRPVAVSDILTQYAPWRIDGAPPPKNPLLDDTATGLHPWMAALRNHGELLETPSVGCGAVGPLASVFGLLSPFVAIPFLLPRSLSLTGMVALDLVASFWSFYAWRRNRGDADTPAALGAAVWAWAPARTVYRTWPHGSLVGVFPLLLFAADLEVEGRWRWERRALLWGGLTILFAIGGHPSFTLMGIYLAAAYGLSRAAGRGLFRREELATLARRAAAPLLGAVLGILVVSPALALSRSFLSEGRWSDVRAPIAHAPPVPWRMLFLLFDPSFYGDPVQGNWRGLGWAGPDNLVELQLYMGLATLFLAPIAWARWPRRREVLFWSAVGAGALVVLLLGGVFAGAARLLPGLGIVFFSRLRLLALFAAACLVALGAEALGAVRLFGARAGRLVLPGLLVFTTLDLSLANLRFLPFAKGPDTRPAETPALRRLRALAPGDGHRFLGLGTAVVPNLAFDLDLEDVRAHLLHSAGLRSFLSSLDPMVFGRRGTFLTFEPGTFRADAWALDLLGVSALIAPPGSPAPGGDFTLDHAGPDADVYARAWRPPANFLSRDFTRRDPAGRVESFEAHRTRWRVETRSSEAGILVLGRSRLPLTNDVSLDGRRVPCLSDPRAEGLIAVAVPAGPHRVTVVPSLGGPWASLSLAGAALLLGLAAAAFRR